MDDKKQLRSSLEQCSAESVKVVMQDDIRSMKRRDPFVRVCPENVQIPSQISLCPNLFSKIYTFAVSHASKNNCKIATSPGISTIMQ